MTGKKSVGLHFILSFNFYFIFNYALFLLSLCFMSLNLVSKKEKTEITDCLCELFFFLYFWCLIPHICKGFLENMEKKKFTVKVFYTGRGLVKAKKKKCCISCSSTDLKFLAPTQNFFLWCAGCVFCCWKHYRFQFITANSVVHNGISRDMATLTMQKWLFFFTLRLHL